MSAKENNKMSDSGNKISFINEKVTTVGVGVRALCERMTPSAKRDYEEAEGHRCIPRHDCCDREGCGFAIYQE